MPGSCHVWMAPGWQGVFSIFCRLVGCSHVSGLVGLPLALMLSADLVPIIPTRFLTR